MKTDTQVQKDVEAELNWEASVKSTDIGVEVHDGIVTLAGHVGSYAQKKAAEDAAQRVAGVQGLAVEMDVKLEGRAKRTDADIAKSAADILMWTGSLPSGAVKVMVENGWLTLTGQVEWQYQRQSAQEAVRYLIGVTGISNDVTVKPAAASKVIKSDIEAALKRNSILGDGDISVGVTGATVTLSGRVDSWSDRSSATYIAWGTPGVQKVVDNITLAC